METNDEAFRRWFKANEKREQYEWDVLWDGTVEHGTAIANKQTDRITEANAKFSTNYLTAFNITGAKR